MATKEKAPKIRFSEHPGGWNKVRILQRAWQHIRVNLSGNKDLAICKICDEEIDLANQFRPKDQILREFTRKHFYKHNLWQQYELPAASGMAPEVASAS